MTYEALVSPTLWAVSLGTAVWFAVGAARSRRTAKADKGARATELAQTRAKQLARRAALVLVGALVVVPAVAIVPAGHRGVVYRLSGGVSMAERPEGLTLLLPWAQRMTTVSVRTQKVFSDAVYAQSNDLQEITVVASVNYHVAPDMAAELYQEVGLDYETTVIDPAMFQQVKTSVGQVLAEDFAANRASLAVQIQAGLEAQLAPYGIIVEYVNIEDAIFDPEFIASVKAKVIADQVAAEQERLVAAELGRKKQAIVQAQGRARSIAIEARAQARANRVIAASLTGKLLGWKLLVNWNGVLPTTLVTDGSSVTFLLQPPTSQGPI